MVMEDKCGNTPMLYTQRCHLLDHADQLVAIEPGDGAWVVLLFIVCAGWLSEFCIC